jgi:hypothetical protein
MLEVDRTLVHAPLSLSQVLQQTAPLPHAQGSLGAVPNQHLTFGPTSAGQTSEVDLPLLTVARQRAEQEWLGAIAALVKLLLCSNPKPERSPQPHAADQPMGVALSGPFPVLPDQFLGQTLSQWLLIPEPLEQILAVARPLLPGQSSPLATNLRSNVTMVPLESRDPLARERFCLLLTNRFSLILLLGEDGNGQPQFQFSFDPEPIWAVWQQLRERVLQARPPLVATLDQAIEAFPPVPPDYRLVTDYSHLLLQQLRPLSAVTPLTPEGGAGSVGDEPATSAGLLGGKRARATAVTRD